MRMRSLAVVAISTTLSLLAIEIVLRSFGLGLGNSPLEGDPVLHHVHPKNYKFVAFSGTGEYGGFLIQYDNDGFRVGSNSRSRPYRVLVLGDSYVEANQVPHDQSFVGRL